jgi:hypothetical protein
LGLSGLLFFRKNLAGIDILYFDFRFENQNRKGRAITYITVIIMP